MWCQCGELNTHLHSTNSRAVGIPWRPRPQRTGRLGLPHIIFSISLCLLMSAAELSPAPTALSVQIGENDVTYLVPVDVDMRQHRQTRCLPVFYRGCQLLRSAGTQILSAASGSRFLVVRWTSCQGKPSCVTVTYLRCIDLPLPVDQSILVLRR